MTPPIPARTLIAPYARLGAMTPPAPALLLALRLLACSPSAGLAPKAAPDGALEVCKKISKVMVVDKLTRLEAADPPARCCSSISAVASSTLAADPPATVASGLPPIEKLNQI
uniref:Uncharacterized protein n=1 Tax=Oryza glumipatula TaxID=40148 RepID=A0A0E0AZ95_9ORYZ